MALSSSPTPRRQGFWGSSTIKCHADDAFVHRGVIEERLPFIEKPFTRDQLSRPVREVLDG